MKMQPLNITALQKSAFWHLFSPAKRQMPVLTVKTADSGLENQNILKLDEKLDKKEGSKLQNGRQITARDPKPLCKVRGRDHVVISKVV